MSDNSLEFLKSFPDPNIPNEKKETKSYVGAYIRAAHLQWKSGGSAEQYADRARKYKAKSYRMGTQSTAEMENLLNIEGDIVDLNLNYAAIPIVQKFADVVVNNVLNDNFKVKLEASDNISKKRKDDIEKGLKADMLVKPFEDMLNQITGLGLTKEGVPNSKEELEIQMKIDYRDPLEIALETFVEMVLNNNGFPEIKRAIVDDMVCYNEIATRTDVNGKDGVTVNYVEGQNFIRSLSRFADNRDLKYAGEVKRMTFGEWRNMLTPEDGITNEMIEKLANDMATVSGGNTGTNNFNDPVYPDQMNGRTRWYDSLTLDVVLMEFKDFNFDTYEKKQTKFGLPTMHKKKTGYIPPKESTYEREIFTDTYETVLKGGWVVGSELDYTFGVGYANNILLYGKKMNKARLNYVVYTIAGKSLVERMMPFADQMFISFVKQQHLMAKLRPSGINVNVSALEDALTKEGDGDEYYQPIDLLNYYDISGNVLFRDDTAEDGIPRRTTPITPNDNKMGTQLHELSQVWANNLDTIRDMTNVNKFVDGSMTSSKTLVGVQEKGIEQSNTGTYQINAGMESVIVGIARNVICHGQDMFKYTDIVDAYEAGIGELNVDVIRRIKDIPISQINIAIEYEPSDAEKAVLNADINAAISSQELKIEDGILIREIDNIRLANKMLIMRKKQYAKEIQEQQQAQMQAEQEFAAQQAEQDMQMKEMELGMKAQFQAQIEEMKGQQAIALEQAKAASDAQLMDKEYGYKIQIAQMTVGADMEKMERAENGKDSRIDKTKTAESQLVEQKEYKTGPKDFTKEAFKKNMAI